MPSSASLALLFALEFATAHANPLQYHRETLQLRRQNVQQQPPTIPPSIWTPTVTIFVVFFSLALLVCLGRVIFRRRAEIARRSAELARQNQGTTDQVVGTSNGRPGTGNNPPRRTRRPRPRRTPSQMSVTSLPEYMKDPGAQEVVIFRGQSMDTMPGSNVMEHSDEEREDTHSQDSHNAPLLRSAQGGHRPEPTLAMSTEESRRESMGSGSNDISSLRRIEIREPSPAYFEVMDPDTQPSTIYPPPTAPSSASPSSSETPAVRSGFRNLLSRISMHHRSDSGNTALLSQHRHTPSTSSSFLTAFRAHRSTNSVDSDRMNSPSMISLTSISAPLTHTAMRTDFTYPKTGPTAEQLKILASREAIGKFSVPYGPDAIAFAASTSWHDLVPPGPPPGFEEVTDSDLQRTPHQSAGPSRLRSPVPLENENSIELSASPSSHERVTTITPSSAPNGSAEPVIAITNSESPTEEPNPQNFSESDRMPHTQVMDTAQTLAIPSRATHNPAHNNVLRSDSIASVSSNQTYATATESFDQSRAVSENGDVGGSSDVQASVTLKLMPQRGHEAEPTDVTITLTNSGSVSTR